MGYVRCGAVRCGAASVIVLELLVTFKISNFRRLVPYMPFLDIHHANTSFYSGPSNFNFIKKSLQGYSLFSFFFLA